MWLKFVCKYLNRVSCLQFYLMTMRNLGVKSFASIPPSRPHLKAQTQKMKRPTKENLSARPDIKAFGDAVKPTSSYKCLLLQGLQSKQVQAAAYEAMETALLWLDGQVSFTLIHMDMMDPVHSGCWLAH